MRDAHTFVIARNTRVALDTSFSMKRPSIRLCRSTVRAFVTMRRRSHTRVSLLSKGSLSPTPPSVLMPAASESESELRPKSAHDSFEELKPS